MGQSAYSIAMKEMGVLIDKANLNEAAVEKALEPVNAQLADIAVNVRSFGAKGDGVTDDISAIQAAIDFVEAQGGGKVKIPVGTFCISDSIKRKTKVDIEGAGSVATVILTTRESIHAFVSVGLLNQSNLSHMKIKCLTLGTVNAAITFDKTNGATQNREHDLFIENFAYGFDCGDNWYSNSIDNVKFWKPINAFRLLYTTIGVAIQNSISNTYVHQPRGYSVNVNGFKRLQFYNLNIDTTSFPTGIFINTNSQVSIIGFNCEGSALANGESIVTIRGGSDVILMNGQLSPASITSGTAYGLYIASDNTKVALLNVNISTLSGFRQVYTANAQNSLLTNLSPNVIDIFNATGVNANGIVNNVNGFLTLVSPIIKFNGGVQEYILAMPTRNMRIKSIKLVYSEYVSSEAGIPITVKWATGNQYIIATLTTEVNKAKWSSTVGTLTNTSLNAGIPLLVTCDGAKGGTGAAQVIIEYWNE